ncbi:MAD2L1-binding protein [Bagarius yarrelli]|uniref:MAD2L1-binding protein n=1 Tax=Bagarius yarrelli TaxID=175774 RepID=A0A556U780_BAGYA|nr:MAD2L1-binding protein [Bagarius yarrelli]
MTVWRSGCSSIMKTLSRIVKVLSKQELKRAEEVLRQHFPQSQAAYGHVFLLNRVEVEPTDVLVDQWPDFRVLLVKSRQQQHEELFKAVAVNKGVPMTKSSVAYLMEMKDPSKVTTERLSVQVSPIQESHAALINNTWKFGNGEVTEPLIRSMIRTLPSYCVLDTEGRPVSWVLTYASGAMGVAYTRPEHRGKGFTKAVTTTLVKKLHSEGYPVYCFVEESNLLPYMQLTVKGFTKAPSSPTDYPPHRQCYFSLARHTLTSLPHSQTFVVVDNPGPHPPPRTPTTTLMVYGYVFMMNRVKADAIDVLVDRWPDFNVLLIRPQRLERFSEEVEVSTVMTDISKPDTVIYNRAELQRKCEELTERALSEQNPKKGTGNSNEPALIPRLNTAACSEVQLPTAAESLHGVEEQANNQHNESLQLGQMSQQQKPHCSRMSTRQPLRNDDDDEEVVRKAREEGRVDVVFSGCVTQDGCCRFVCELLKLILYQRQQLPMTYDQMVSFHKQQLANTQLEEGAVRKSIKPSGDSTWQRCLRTLRELDEVLGHLEVLFSLSHVPRVLFMLGGSGILPTESYEINMEALAQGGGDRSLRTSLCLRKLFRTLFVADLLSDVKSVRLMGTTVMALAHRDCGVDWFKPKVDFRVQRGEENVISLASETSESRDMIVDTRDPEDYIWFQTPVTIKGFK